MCSVLVTIISLIRHVVPPFALVFGLFYRLQWLVRKRRGVGEGVSLGEPGRRLDLKGELFMPS